jgi:toxin-antitoxin system PIN domain toxin
LAWPNHVHHQPALAWFARRGAQPWATTPFTEAGFVRVSSNVSVIPAAVTPTEAMALLERMREVFEHRFLIDDVPLVVGMYLGAGRVASYRHVTDAHLLAVARRHGASLATFDRGIAALAGGKDLVVVPLS